MRAPTRYLAITVAFFASLLRAEEDQQSSNPARTVADGIDSANTYIVDNAKALLAFLEKYAENSNGKLDIDSGDLAKGNQLLNQAGIVADGVSGYIDVSQQFQNQGGGAAAVQLVGEVGNSLTDAALLKKIIAASKGVPIARAPVVAAMFFLASDQKEESIQDVVDVTIGSGKDIGNAFAQLADAYDDLSQEPKDAAWYLEKQNAYREELEKLEAERVAAETEYFNQYYGDGGKGEGVMEELADMLQKPDPPKKERSPEFEAALRGVTFEFIPLMQELVAMGGDGEKIMGSMLETLGRQFGLTVEEVAMELERYQQDLIAEGIRIPGKQENKPEDDTKTEEEKIQRILILMDKLEAHPVRKLATHQDALILGIHVKNPQYQAAIARETRKLEEDFVNIEIEMKAYREMETEYEKLLSEVSREKLQIAVQKRRSVMGNSLNR